MAADRCEATAAAIAEISTMRICVAAFFFPNFSRHFWLLERNFPMTRPDKKKSYLAAPGFDPGTSRL